MDKQRSLLLTNPTLRALLLIVFFTYSAQNMLNVSIAPLARSLQLAEWAVGLAVSLAALFVTSLSSFWGVKSLDWGRRRVLLIALTLALSAAIIFSAAVVLRSEGVIGSASATTAIVLARGAFFGAAVSAIPPTGQALIATLTPDEASRVRGMSAFSGAISASIMVGSLVSSALGAWNIYGPVHATGILIAFALVTCFFFVPVTPPPPKKEKPVKVSWRDPRILPWILAGLGMFFTNGIVQITTGFVAQDRLGLSPEKAMPVTGGLLLAGACGAMLMQIVIVPRLGTTPRKLVRWGLVIALLSLIGYGTVTSFSLLALSAFGVGVGMGTVSPGYNAGASLEVEKHELGGVAGVLNAAGAVTWIIGPVSATSLYSWNSYAPFIVAGVALLASTILAWLHPTFRRPTPVISD
ncbi:MFS transporter [Boudabousia tangfeifanii]|uniref:MFS transporter n=1 Tax=Boudabousia tangfeifanii TaxID=1912795 RepID=A0A1D9MKE6_9ACTO|nr:MFS transporter [Boudabousia tangfeifanii]AOZ72756.1 MFS transporter [Boudabousia tangfeifanii]